MNSRFEFTYDEDAILEEVSVVEEEAVTLEDMVYTCPRLAVFPRCNRFVEFKDLVTSKIQSKIDRLLQNLNVLPNKIIHNTIIGTKRIGSKLWVLGDTMAGVSTQQAPITTDGLQLIDDIYKHSPQLIPILLNLCKEIRKLSPEERCNYILNNSDKF